MQTTTKTNSQGFIFQLKNKIIDFLSQDNDSKLSQNQIQTYLRQKLEISLQPEPQLYLNSISELETLKKSLIVNVQLMIHDMQDGGYTTPYLISRPFNQNSDVQILKFGNHHQCQQHNQKIMEKLQSQKYFRFLQERQIIIGVPVLYETQWCKKVTDNKMKKMQKIEIVVDFRSKFKLGQTVNIVGLWKPEEKKLYFIKQISKEKLEKSHLLTNYLAFQITDFEQVKKQILILISKFFSDKYSHFALYSILSRNFFFISAQWNISKLVKLLLPRVNCLSIKAPFQESLFPYKNQDEFIVNTPMEMSSNHTYTILDFSQLSQDKQIKIKQTQIDNLKALKIFVQQGQTIYRWIYGESLLPHCHTGMIIKASSIINPQYIIKGQKQCELSQIDDILSAISEQKWHQFRAYIHQARNLDPYLSQQSKNQIQKHMHQNIKIFNQTSIHQVMELSKINAQSCGRIQTKFQDYMQAIKLFFGEQFLLNQTAQFKKKQQNQKESKEKINEQKKVSQKIIQEPQNPQKHQKAQKL